jgi:hypothetical protein
MEDAYKIFYIPKAKGYRKIVTYRSSESDVYRFHIDAKQSLERHIRHSKFAKAYIKHRSIITNAQAHLYNDIFICLDICDFFQSINHNKLISALYHEINRTSKKQFTMEQCKSLVNSCSLSKKGIAIGLTPSPILANVYLKEFDTKLYAWLKKQNFPNIIYTRYADDITISFKETEEDSVKIVDSIIARVRVLLEDFHLKLNDKKTRIINLRVSNHVRITGINLTRDSNNYRKLTVGRKRKDDLFYSAMDEYKKESEKKHAQKIKGMQSFILSVEGEAYEASYSPNMKNAIKELGFNSLKELIDSL